MRWLVQPMNVLSNPLYGCDTDLCPQGCLIQGCNCDFCLLNTSGKKGTCLINVYATYGALY